ncbi:MAG: 4-hydroxy-tetrahydrodipicolinate reductase [Oscillospiraceae bacterium]|nr:4-hydroxy-tetrahydrodipicolinate reductase [Oscillospiraceae bacterium]
MLNILLSGCNGYMGRVVTEIVASDPTVAIVAGLDINPEKHSDYPVFATPDEILSDNLIYGADVIVDFSATSAIDGLIGLSVSQKVPIILCVTGYTAQQLDQIEEASKHVAVFQSGNMSIGINLLADLVKRACAVLGEEFDVEIVERHHRRKVDAPSGTALMLADAATSALQYEPEYVYERESKCDPRQNHEIGISAVRGGTIVGVHNVIFAGQDEIIELTHTATSRDVFATGAIKAAKYMVNKQPGMYNMSDVLK